MSGAVQFQKASRQRVWLKLAIAGPSGSGKTLGALAIAKAIAAAEGSRVAVIDTENNSASLYADKYDFDALPLGPPYLSRKYLDGVQAAIDAGYKVLMIDSTSHQWEGEGGILQRKDDADAVPGTNHWTNWNPFTKEHNEFRAALLNAPIHIIATMRSKQAYAQSENGSKKKVEKLGMAPIQRDGMEYEFTVFFDVAMDHEASSSKDRTDLFANRRVDLADPKTAQAIIDWRASAKAEVSAPSPAPAATAEKPKLTVAHGGAAAGSVTADTLMPFGKYKGMPLGGLSSEYLVHLVGLGAKLPAAWTAAASEVLEARRFAELDKEEHAADSRPMTQGDLLKNEPAKDPAPPAPASDEKGGEGDGLPY